MGYVKYFYYGETMVVNVYCDESCHLENDNIKVMAIGGIYLPENSVSQINRDVNQIKSQHNIPRFREIKWTKVSVSLIEYYTDLVNYFFENELLSFRAVLIPDKTKLNHIEFNQTFDEFYYKMYYLTLVKILGVDSNIKVYIDIKDTNGSNKVAKLQSILNSKARDKNKITRIQQIRSHESTILQLADLLIGALTYINRGLNTSEAKNEICRLIIEKTGQSLKESSHFSERKFNIFCFDGRIR